MVTRNSGSSGFSKMNLVSPDVYNKILHDNSVMYGIDNEMMKILRLKKIEDSRKWYLYRQALINYSSRRRNEDYKSTVALPKLPDAPSLK